MIGNQNMNPHHNFYHQNQNFNNSLLPHNIINQKLQNANL